jgi:threonine dehydrogenase-like Zn-dependent dehydrogenase
MAQCRSKRPCPELIYIFCFQFIKWNGRIVVVGFAAGNIEKIPANLILLKQATVMGVFWGNYYFNEVRR